jgi:hypothetical protein
MTFFRFNTMRSPLYFFASEHVFFSIATHSAKGFPIFFERFLWVGDARGIVQGGLRTWVKD